MISEGIYIFLHSISSMQPTNQYNTMGRWVDGTFVSLTDASDVPSIIYFHYFLQNSLQNSLQNPFNLFFFYLFIT